MSTLVQKVGVSCLGVVALFFLFLGVGAAQGPEEQGEIYVPSYRDTQLLDRIEEHVDTYIDEGKRNRITYLLVRMDELQADFSDDPQALFIFYEIGVILQNALTRMNENQEIYTVKELTEDEGESTDSVQPVSPKDIEPVTQQETNTKPEIVIIDEDDGLPPVIVMPTPLKEFSRSGFLVEYLPYMQGEKPLYESCFTHYESIDAVAKKNDFPTALVIATWYREHSCFMKNPANGRGNFQIISHEYPEGEITLPTLLAQVQEFIDFSKAKRDYYDLVQKFGEEPIVLEYDNFDLSSIRKHAIFYNGVYPSVTLDKSRYSNENFTRSRGGRDGIVAAMLKVLQREREQGYIQ